MGEGLWGRALRMGWVNYHLIESRFPPLWSPSYASPHEDDHYLCPHFFTDQG